ncbi:hypothetical protein TBLA_0G02100 [Henningerozyma blattae CBS 6284]|uniref:UvrD-like helicase ATP-binding domain-containing protein n=1 Tax=Henningerozyma blattae (strain ATCC 34711 / CBS 6284 / DSM 70876 / NBRC 10599 / NRRL Y-10934 / UCD 77-7) TaxID=1071380 RepID=I2H700_HENB6|nr:hypothetical protein TBLA_0G02100 [Tetrapisispora blattae CBS 6284]CCH62152.1 hypothetical protein TBLA_0G02100 [Tetrapisispora blattae CBS 6284]
MTDITNNKIYENAKKFLEPIENVYSGSNESIQEAALLGELLKLLSDLPADFHLFCDPIFEPISIFCLTIFSFNEQETVNWLKTKFNPTLSSCNNCVLKFIRGKCRMLQHFAIRRHVPHEHVSKFNDIVCSWRSEALMPVLTSIAVNGTRIEITKNVETALFECLCNPHVLRLNSKLKSAFNAIFKYFYVSKLPLLDFDHPDSINTFVAGVIYCLCEGTEEEILWGRSFAKRLLSKQVTFNSKTITSDILEELNMHFLFLQNPSNWNDVVISLFWSKLIPIFALFEKDVFSEYFEIPKNKISLEKTLKFPIESIFKLWYNHLSRPSRDKPIEFLLRALNLFLDKWNSEFWKKLEPYTFHNLLDIIFDKAIFATKLIRIQNNPIPDDDITTMLSHMGSITDLVSWTLPFYSSLTSSKRIQMVKKVSMSFLKIMVNFKDLSSISKACLINSSTALLRAVLSVKEEERLLLYQKDSFETVLYTKTDSRILLNNPLVQDTLLRSISKPLELYPGLGESATSVSTSAMMVLTKAINFDILLLCEFTYKIYKNKPIGSVSFNKTLIENLSQRLDLCSFHDGPLLAKQLLTSLRNINGLLIVPSKTKEASTNNEYVAQFLSFSTNLIEKFGDVLPHELKKILNDEHAAQGFWSCIFSANTDVYQTTTNILYDTFDVQGRLEGIQAILTLNLDVQLQAINSVLSQLIKCEFYEPCPRAINILKDIIGSFLDPISGIFSNYDTLKNVSTESTLVQFWQLIWSFLDMIYRSTLTWATQYEYSELENFTKDTLDLSRLLIDSFREYSDILKDLNADLFKWVFIAFKNMLYWLRLSDEALLESCVRLIVNTSDIAVEKHIKFNDEVVEMMAKYGSKAKRFSNRLTDQQTEEILTKSRLFNKQVTDDIVHESEVYHKEKAKAKEVSVTLANKTSLPQQHESRADILQRKATSSSIMGRPKATQSRITSFGTLQPSSSMTLSRSTTVKPLSKMELARKQLMSKRVIHPASTTVFHTKPQTHKLDESSSEESDGDIESARELFATAKSKTKTIETVDMTGKIIHKQNAVDRAKQEQEFMRRRLNIDLNPLYESILQWEFTKSDDYPDTINAQSLKPVKDKFSSVVDYQNTMRPLLLLECWQGLCNTRDKEDFRPFSIIVGNRTAVSDFYEVYASIPKQMIQESSISESDLIVLAHFPNLYPNQKLTSDDFKHTPDTCLAKIKSMKNAKGERVDITLRVHRNHRFSKFLSLRTEIHAMKVMQMTTVEREYTTLEGLEYYDLVNQILEANPTPHVEASHGEIERVKANYKLNTSQAEAIVNTVSNPGFSLIQGPPGTGKTKTILGIIGYFLSTSKMVPSNVIRAPEGVTNSESSKDKLLKKQKILICAPSNAAVDEVVLRLKSGIYDKDGKHFIPNLVRVGRSDAVNAAIKDVTLEELVDKRLAKKNYEFSNNPELNKTFNEQVAKRRQLREKLDRENGSVESKLSTEDIANLQIEIRQLSKNINELGKQRDEIRERNSINYRNRDLDRRNTQASILAGSDIICSTLSGSAHDVLASLGVQFDTVIIDEACQCTELSSIIPLRYGGKRCIMVGDPNQLPPTVLSGAASDFNYNQSLFVRMEKNTKPYLLNVQYRMHPLISRFPSKEFYKRELKDGPDMEKITARPWHSLEALGPYKFFDIVSGKQEQNIKTMSYVNPEEVRVAIELIDYLLRHFEKKVDFTGKIGVISPYREQMMKMKRDFNSYFGGVISTYVDFNTIDGFQGQEKEIILLSCVRADASKTGVGFLKDFRRMNVALTRAKSSMWILGHHKSLYKNKLWKHLIEDAHKRNALTSACSGFLNINNAQAQAILDRHKNSHSYLSNGSTSTKDISYHKRKSDDMFPEPKKFAKSENNEKIDRRESKDSGVTKEAVEKKEKKERKEKRDKKKRRIKEKKDKKDKRNKKEKKEKAKDGPSSTTGNSSNTVASGTKKKSSIFGAPSLVTEIIDTKTREDSNNGTVPKKHKKIDTRHVSFSDSVKYIPNSGEEDKDEYIPSAATEQFKNVERIRSPPLPTELSNTETIPNIDEEDDYTPVIKQQPTNKPSNNLTRTNSNGSRYSGSHFMGSDSNITGPITSRYNPCVPQIDSNPVRYGNVRNNDGRYVYDNTSYGMRPPMKQFVKPTNSGSFPPSNNNGGMSSDYYKRNANDFSSTTSSTYPSNYSPVGNNNNPSSYDYSKPGPPQHLYPPNNYPNNSKGSRSRGSNYSPFIPKRRRPHGP